MISKSEKKAIATVLRLGKTYGYGNMIGWLRREWALSLIEEECVYSRDEYDEALEATNSHGYPIDWSYWRMESTYEM